jgi:hypothetical protein
MADPEAQLEAFLSKYTSDVAETGWAGIARLRELLPECDALVYDNYNALAIGFSPNGKTGMAILSLALYPRWVSLFVSAALDDPHGLLKGSGGRMRHVVLHGGADDLDRSEVAAFVTQSRERAGGLIEAGRKGALVIKSVSAKQRARR